MRALAISTAAAVVIQPVVFWAWFLLPALFQGGTVRVAEVGEMALYVLVVALVFVFILGLPIFLALRWSNQAKTFPLGVSGFLAGAIPYAIYNWPSSPIDSTGTTSYFRAYWHGQYVDLSVNGSPTIYGWLNYSENVLMFGVHGLVGALVFFWVWRRLARQEVKRGERSG